MRLSATAAVSLLSLLACSKTNKLDGFEGAVTMHTTTATGSQDLVLDVKGEHLRFDMKTPQGDPMHAVLDPATNKVTVYLDASKSYMDLDFASPTAPQASTSADTSNIVKSGKHETVAGYDCEDWTVADASGKKSEVCIAQGIAFVDLASLKGGAPQSALAKEFREKKSFPLRSVDYDASGKELTRSEVTKIEPKTIDDSAFAPPAGYSKVTAPASAH